MSPCRRRSSNSSQKLRRDHGSAVVLITHDMGVVAEVADRVMVMYAGRVVEHGAKRDLFKSPWHPYTWGLLDSIPPLDGARPRRLKSIGGIPPSLLALPPGCAFAPRCRHRFHRCGERPELAGGNGHEAACFLPPSEREARARPAAAPARRVMNGAEARRRCWRRSASARISSSAGALRRGRRAASSMPSTMSR